MINILYICETIPEIILLMMLLETWDGITPFPECGILKAKNDH